MIDNFFLVWVSVTAVSLVVFGTTAIYLTRPRPVSTDDDAGRWWWSIR